MYAWLWRTLPGGTALKAAQTVLCGIAVLALLLLVVFPWASHHVPFLRVTVEDPAGSTSTAQPGGSPATQSGARSVPSTGTTPLMRKSSTIASMHGEPLL